MAKPLSKEQLAALRWYADEKIDETRNVRGLVARGLLRYRWGNNGDMGYVITDAGKRALADLRRSA